MTEHQAYLAHIRRLQADAAALRHFLEIEVLPRYVEMFEQLFGGPSVIVEDAAKLLASPNPGADLLAELARHRTALSQLLAKISQTTTAGDLQVYSHSVGEIVEMVEMVLSGGPEPPEYSRTADPDC